MTGPSDTEPLPISLVAQHVFCPRRAWLEAAGETTDTYQMAVAIAEHLPTENPATGRPDRLRVVEVVNPEWGVIGRCDTVERESDGSLTVIEHKATPVSRRPDVTEPMRVQLALQVESLKSMGYKVCGQEVYFTSHRFSVPVPLAEADISRARAEIDATRLTVTSATAPPLLEDDPRCTSCSHASVCLPEERSGRPVRRRIAVADPDCQVVHLATPGSRVSLRDGRVLVSHRGEEISSIPIERVQSLVLHGNVDLSGALIRGMMWRSRPIVWCTGVGRVVGWSVSGSAPNGLQRVRQHEMSATGRLDLAREFVGSKIANQATFLRRNGASLDTVTLLRKL